MPVHRTPARASRRSLKSVVKAHAKSLMLAALATGATVAQAGPDVIVGDLDQVQNWGQVSGIRAYSVGTVSCNIGDQPLEWEDQPQPGFTGNIYPVISGNVYRLRDGRFQQLGQQWLKHGFCALNGNVCSSCPQQSNPGCRYLMPGCSDPYSASLNGSQGGLGPKYEVNPSTGFFPVNWTAIGSNGNTTGDAIYKRIQVPDSELSATNGTYFVSSIYIHPQDSTNNVDNNSQSYRRVTVSGANKDLLVTDTTQRQKPAIFAWKDYGNGATGGSGIPDETVLLSPIDVPDDGRFWVGSKVISLGNGQFRYEYAVQNLTSHRAGREFRVPVAATANVTGIGFADVGYHSGERQRGDDWTISVSDGYVTWTMPDLYADDQWENALRWDTIYNFWFVSDVPPATGDVQLKLFLAGSATDTHQAFVHTAGVGGTPPPPSNDNCASAIALGNGSTAAFDTTSATTDGLAESLCNFSSNNQITNDVWYTFTTTNCAGDLTVSTCGSSFDTKLAIYPGTPCPSGIDMAIACNDDSSVCPTNNGLSSIITFAAAANTTYRVRVGGFNGATGTGQLSITRPVCVPAAPVNDRCSNALWITDGQTITGSTALATNTAADGPAACSSGTSRDVWFKYRPTVSGPVVIGTCGSTFDTVLSVHGSCGGASIRCNDEHNTAGYCSSPNASRVSVNLNAGTTYLIRMAGWGASSFGDFALTVTGGGGIAPPSNDDCSGRAGIGLGNQAFSLVGATTDGPTHGGLTAHNDVWYNHPGLCTGNLRIRVCNPQGFTPRLAVYSGEGCANLESRFLGFGVPAASTECGSAAVEYTVLGLQAGTPVSIRVGSLSASSFGTGTLQLECLPAGPTCNDIDFNNDQLFPDDSDLVAFLDVLAGGSCPTAACDDIDFNNDGLFPDDQDLLTFLRVLAGGDC
jgi:hypothetical protein